MFEHYNFNYNQIPEERDNVCKVQSDSFYNTYQNTDERVREKFIKWCSDYKKITRSYPNSPTAEMAFIGMKKYFDNFNECLSLDD
jgi:hypothetical protein